jgi:tetratricopeptide (TPR) repeat protein
MASTLQPAQPVKVFISYAQQDKELNERLLHHLRGLERWKDIVIWQNRDIISGTEWEHEVDAHLNTAKLILLLVSPDFMASDYCYSVEMKRALEMHASGDARVIPILLRPTDWRGAPFSELQALPTNSKAVTSAKNLDEALHDITWSIWKIVRELKAPTHVPDKNASRNFFISYNSADRLWAEWVAWQLEEAGYSILLQAWDFRPGSNFVMEMHQASRMAERTVAILSPNYLNALYTQPEWATAFAQDPTGALGTLLPVCVRPLKTGCLLGQLVYIDLVGLDEATARERLLQGVRFPRKKVAVPPAFPGKVQHSLPKPPRFPEALASAKQTHLPESQPAIWNMPYQRNPFFTGREDFLMRLHETLATGKQAALTQPQVISGLGGIGKTQVAVEYAYRYCSEYQAVLWVRANTREAVISDLIAITDLLNLPEKNDQDQSRIVAAVRRWLSDSTGWLLILDNVDDITVVRSLIPESIRGHILLTTRLADTEPFKSIKIDTLMPDEGVLLLLRHAGFIAKDGSLDTVVPSELDKAREISRMMEGLPLALDLAGSYVQETHCSLDGFLDIYRSHRANLFYKSDTSLPDVPLPVANTLSLALSELKDALATELLKFCAFLAPDAIPEEIILEGAPELGSQFQSVADDPFKLNDALNELRKFSLIHRDLDAKTLTVHPLIQAFMKQSMNKQWKREWADCTVRAVSRTFPSVEFATWQRCQRFLPHTLVCAKLIDQYSMTSAVARKLLSQAGYYLCIRAQYAQAEQLLTRALTIDQQTLELEDTAYDLNRLAELYRAQGRYREAELLYKRAIETYKQMRGSNHPDVALCLNNLAGLYYDQGRYIQATLLYNQVLTIWEQNLGKDHPDQIENLNHLAEIYSIQGKYDQAESILQRVMSVNEQAMGPEHPDLITSLNDLARLYHIQGKYAQAETLYQKALALREKVLGPEHPDIATTLNGLAELYDNLGQPTKAEPLYQRALTIREHVLGLDHPDVARSLNSLAHLYRDQDKREEAETAYRRALTIYENALGLDHPDVARSLNSLAQLYRDQDKHEEAETAYRRALTIYENALGSDHPSTARCLNDLGTFYKEQRRYKEAEAAYQRAVGIYEKALGPDHPDVAQCLNNLGKLYKTQALYSEAEPFFRRALAIYEQTLGTQHPAVALCLNSLAEDYRLQSKYAEAEPLYQRALAIWEKTFGPSHPNITKVLKSYVTLLRRMRRDVDAAQLEARIKSSRSE